MKSILQDLEAAHKLFKTISSVYNQNYQAMKDCEDAENDIRHSIEFGGHKYKERAKLATRQMIILQERRKHQSRLTLIEPLYEFMQEPNSVEFMKRLDIVLGETRKRDKKREYRCYKDRTGIVSDVLKREVL